jgi:allantoinase
MNSVTVVRGERVVLPDGVRPAAIHIAGGRILAVGEYSGPLPAGGDLLDAAGAVILPGLVDTHVHINEPGRTDWEGFSHATRAAAAGGVTTLVDMPLNSVPSTTNVSALEAKRRAAAGQCHVDVGFWGGVVPGNAADLEPLVAAGARGFKCFLAPSGVDEFEHVTEKDLREALPIIASLRVPLLVHAELPSELIAPVGDPSSYSTWLASRPSRAETAAIDRLIALAGEYGARIHIVHLATGLALPALRAARARGLPITVETCPHYLTFASEQIAPGAVQFKCAPPIREEANREQLWRALGSGDIDMIATDHSPAPPSMKRGDFVRAWGGVGSLQLGLAAVWAGASARGYRVEDVARWMADFPARLAGLADRKGRIAAGEDADLVLWDPDHAGVVDATALFHRHHLTPYEGLTLKGRVVRTMLRGRIVFDAGVVTAPPSGAFI